VEDTPRNLIVAKELGMITVLVGPLVDRPEYVDYLVSHPAEVAALAARLLAEPAA
jgi:FMN phosphatase YigB (HAD superfamily)